MNVYWTPQKTKQGGSFAYCGRNPISAWIIKFTTGYRIRWNLKTVNEKIVALGGSGAFPIDRRHVTTTQRNKFWCCGLVWLLRINRRMKTIGFRLKLVPIVLGICVAAFTIYALPLYDAVNWQISNKILFNPNHFVDMGQLLLDYNWVTSGTYRL